MAKIHVFRMRSNKVACSVLILCSALATLLLLPVLIDAMVVHVDILTGQLFTNDSALQTGSVFMDFVKFKVIAFKL